MRVLLIFPRPISEVPTGFAYLNAVLKQKEHEVKALVNTFKYFYTDEEILKEIESYKPDVVGFNIGTLQLLSTYSLIKKIPSSVSCIMAGGPHATTCPEEVLNNGVDIVIRNEGEETLSELCDYLEQFNKDVLDKPLIDIKDILGISYITVSGEIIHNKQRPYKDFKDLPKPDFSCFDLEKFKTSDGIVKGLHRIYCSRGCPGQCTFCDSAIFGRRVRYRPVDEVVEEIKDRYHKYNIESFIIADDTFTASKKYVREFCTKILELKLPVIWGCSTRADRIEDDLFALMKKAGCYLVGFGIESADQETLKRICKGISVEEANHAIDIADKYGFRVYVNLMTGFPWETEEAIKNNIAYINKHFNQVFIYQVSGSLVPYPGTGIYEEFKDKTDIKDWWLRPDYQNFGIQIHQNTLEPYKLSTFYQRILYDDTYIWEEKFFNYSEKYKKLVKKMAFLVGKRNLLSEEPSKIKRIIKYCLCKVSRFIYEINPTIEKKVVSKIVEFINLKSKFHDRGPLGYLKRSLNG